MKPKFDETVWVPKAGLYAQITSSRRNISALHKLDPRFPPFVEGFSKQDVENTIFLIGQRLSAAMGKPMMDAFKKNNEQTIARLYSFYQDGREAVWEYERDFVAFGDVLNMLLVPRRRTILQRIFG